MVLQLQTNPDENNHLLQQTHTQLLQAREKLREALQRGQGVVEQLWNYNTRAWATTVHAADIDGDGDIEILVGLRDGRIYTLTKNKALKWSTDILDPGAGIDAIVGISRYSNEKQVCVVAGSRNGRIFGLSYNGEKVVDAKLGERIHHIYIDPERPAEIFVGCDQYIHILDSQTFQPLQEKFTTGGTIRCIFSYDIDGDHENEIFAASSDFNIYVLASDGSLRAKISTGKDKVYTLFVAPLENGEIALLAGTCNKKLLVWNILPQDMQEDQTLTFQEKRLPFLKEEGFDSCIRTICVVDINKDNFPEILLGTEDKSLHILDRFGKTLWKHSLEQFVATIFATDIDLDGRTELLVGTEDNTVQLLRIELDKENENRYESIFTLSKLLSRKEAQLLYYLIGPQKQINQYHHMEWNWVELFIAQRKYEQALSLLLHLRKQGFQHLWANPITCEGAIRIIDSGNYTRDPESEIVLATDNGYVVIVDIKPSAGKQVISKPLGKGIYRLSTLTNLEGFDYILLESDGHHISILDYAGHKREELILEDEDVASTFYVYKQYTDREHDAVSEILLGLTNGNIYIYNNTLSHRLEAFKTEQDICMLCSSGYSNNQIIIATKNNDICAYTRTGALCWEYKHIRDSVCALLMKDIDDDGYPEIIVGSEDCSVYILNHEGLLKWRYLTPHRVLTVEAADINGDERIEILVGVENCYMYALNGEGDLLWTYKTNDKITAIHAQDLHLHGSRPDGKVEIVLGSDRQLELLQMLDPQRIIERIDLCWQAWQELIDFDNHRRFALKYTEHTNVDIHILALAKLSGFRDKQHADEDLLLITEVLEDKRLEVRQEMARVAINLEKTHGDHPGCKKLVRTIFRELSADPHFEVKLTVVDRLPRLQDTALCFEYLERFMNNEDVWIRRAVIRKLDTLIQHHPERVFSLLLKAVKPARYEQDETLPENEREWLHQEVGRCLAHYFSIHQEKLFWYIQELLAHGSSLQVIQQISYSSPDPELRDLFSILTHMIEILAITDEQERNTQVTDLLDKSIKTLQAISQRNVTDSEALLHLYEELRQLIHVRTINDIEQYKWVGDEDLIEQVSSISQVITTFSGIFKVIEQVRRYRKRQAIGERLGALIQSYNTLKKLHTQITRVEAKRIQIAGDIQHLICPPEDHILLSILSKWMDIVFAEIERIQGKAKLRFTLLRGAAWHEEQVVVSLFITNEGHCPAENVDVRLQESSEFEIKANGGSPIDEITMNSPATIEFTICPLTHTQRLIFHITYTDAEGDKTFTFADKLVLYTYQGKFSPIPDKYHAGGMPLGSSEGDRELFVGRKKDILLLQEKLLLSESNNLIVLSGQRRSGKTSLLYQLMNDITEQNKHIPVLIDLQNLILINDVDQLLKEIANRIHSCIQARGITLSSPESFNSYQHSTTAFNRFLDHALKQLEEQKLILLIDEFEVLQEKIDQGTLSPAFLKYLRSLVQHKQGISLLLAGAPTIRFLTEWYWATFFNIAYTHILSKLETKEAEELITAPVNKYLTYDTLALEKIHWLTNDQPYLIHIMCSMLVQHCNIHKKNYVTINDVNIVCDRIIATQANYFTWIWNQLQDMPVARLILSILARREDLEWVSPGMIRTGLGALGYQIEKDTLRKTLNTLVEEEFVAEEPVDEISDGMQYRIPVGLTKAWLRVVKPLEWVESDISRDDDSSSA